LTIFKDDKEVYWSDSHGLEAKLTYDINIDPAVKGDSVMIRQPCGKIDIFILARYEYTQSGV
jgi:hypothetical protein